ncbi:hypothetical protein [Actinoplanes sp. GCM10030250]|uniref:hypothetical protein n=1 Tax=Actinoplanes sp. GCM10030250 TaxID=3273376 RepID=UPI00360FF9F5
MVISWVRLSLLAPLFAAALGVTALFVSVLPMGLAPESLLFTLWTAATVGAAVLLARLGSWWTVPESRITTLALAATVPSFLACNLMYLLSNSAPKIDRHGPAYAVFFGGLAVLLHLVHRLNVSGRRRAAWWAGALGALVLADVAVAVTVLIAGKLSAVWAPLWLPGALIESGFGVPAVDTVLLLDIVELDPPIYILATGLALGVVMARRRRGRNVVEVSR